MRSLNVFSAPAVAGTFFPQTPFVLFASFTAPLISNFSKAVDIFLRKNEGNRVRGKFPLLILRRGGTSIASDGVVYQGL